MARIGYARVSTVEQNEGRQLEAFKGQQLDKVFVDKMSGKDTARPQLQAMLDYVRDGDVLVVEDISRLARSTRDLLTIVDKLTSKGVAFVSLKEQIDTNTAQGRFMLTVFAALAELERETILDRQSEGIALAKAEGKYKGRQPLPFDEKQFRSECAKWIAGEQTAAQTMRNCKMKPNRFYRKAKELGIRKAADNG